MPLARADYESPHPASLGLRLSCAALPARGREGRLLALGLRCDEEGAADDEAVVARRGDEVGFKAHTVGHRAEFGVIEIKNIRVKE